MSDVNGIHHITCIAADPQENLAFYSGVLGMRLVKRSVNQDDPGTYHFFFADAVGHPGTDLTFFPWAHMAPGRQGPGLASEVGLAVPAGTLDAWERRLRAAGAAVGARETRFGERALTLKDPHGLALALVETGDPRDFTPWEASPVPAAEQVRGLHGVRMGVADLGSTTGFLSQVFGFEAKGDEAGWYRYQNIGSGSGGIVDVRPMPGMPRGRWGRGAVHHVAFRVADDDVQLAVQARVQSAGLAPTPVIDRFWFRSVYFQEPGGVLFELATDGPGFAVDEDASHLGERLVLPPWLEPRRDAIEAALPSIQVPA